MTLLQSSVVGDFDEHAVDEFPTNAVLSCDPKLSGGDDVGESWSPARRRAWLVLEIAISGPKVWDRLAAHLPANQAEQLRQQLDAFLDQLTLAGFDRDDDDARGRALADLRALRLLTPSSPETPGGEGRGEGGQYPSRNLEVSAGSAPSPPTPLPRSTGGEGRVFAVARLRPSSSGDEFPVVAEARIGRLGELRSIDGAAIVETIVRFFEFRELKLGGEVPASYAQFADGRLPMACINLESIANLVSHRSEEWEALLDRPEEPRETNATANTDLDSYLRRGVERLENADYRQAIAHFTAGLKLDATRAEFYARRGDAYRLLGEPRRALSDYHAALHLDPAGAMALLGRAVAYQEIGDFEKARADASAVLEISQRQPLAYRTRAAAAIAQGDFNAALADLAATLDLDADDVDAHFQRGQLLTQAGDNREAVRHFDRVLELHSNHVPALLNRAHARRRLGEYVRSIRDYSDVLRHHPGNALALTSRGLAHELNGDRDSAVADHTEALRLEPDNVVIAFNRAKLYRVRGDASRARADLDAVLQRQPDHFAALYHRGKITMQKGKWSEALLDLDAAIALNPDLGIAYSSRAILRDRLAQYPKALADVDRALELEPDLAVNHLIRGVIATHLRDAAVAIEDLSDAIRLDDQLPLAYQERSIAYTLKGDYDRALSDANRLVALEPSNAQAYAHRSMLLHLRGDVQPALVDYNRALQLDPRVLLTGWHQPLVEHSLNQTTILLSDTVDGLRWRRFSQAAPPPPEWTIVLEKPRQSSRGSDSSRDVPAVRAPITEIRKPIEAVRPEPPRSTANILEKRTEGTSESREPAAPATSIALPSKPISPSPTAETMAQTSAFADTAAETPAAPIEPAPKVREIPFAEEQLPAPVTATEAPAPSPVSAKPKAPAPRVKPREATPTSGEGIKALIEDTFEFDQSVDRAIADLLASGPGGVELHPVKNPPKAPIVPKPVLPATQPAPAKADAPLKPIDCPLCRHSLPPAEVLTGGRFRCGNCNAIFFPGIGKPQSAAFPSAAPKTQPAKRSVTLSDDDEDLTLLQRWRKPKALAVTGVVTLALMYFVLPATLFGNSGRYTVHAAKGEVFLQGKAIPGAVVRFVPVDPPNRDFPEAKGIVGADGSFHLGSYGKDDGAAPGEYKVSVILLPPPTEKEIQNETYRPRNMLPRQYADPETSGLTAKIVAGENRIPAFQLKR